jgi:hypothetical protein
MAENNIIIRGWHDRQEAGFFEYLTLRQMIVCLLCSKYHLIKNYNSAKNKKIAVS